MVFQEFVEDQVFSPVPIAAALRTTKSEIASTLGLGRDAFSRASRIRARKTQLRTRADAGDFEPGLKPRLARCSRLMPGSVPSRCRASAAQRRDLLLRQGKADHVHAYLDRIMAGGYV